MNKLVKHVCLLLFGIGAAALCSPAWSQGISPVVQEFNKKVRGTVLVTNIGDQPKIVTCQAQGFKPDNQGTVRYRPLDASLHVRIDSSGQVVAPRSNRRVSFEADPEVLPAWFAVTCRFVPLNSQPGMTLAYKMSSIVIVHGEKINPHDVSLNALHLGNKVEVEVENHGSGLARVSSVKVSGHGKSANLGHFFLFPHQKRVVEGAWKASASPETVRIQIDKKQLETTVD